MGEFTIKRWKCDRCGVVMDKWLKPIPYIEVSICKDYDVGPGPRVFWKEMCSACTIEVNSEFVAMQESAKAARAALSRSEPENGGRDGE